MKEEILYLPLWWPVSAILALFNHDFISIQHYQDFQMPFLPIVLCGTLYVNAGHSSDVGSSDEMTAYCVSLVCGAQAYDTPGSGEC